jgi:UDP-N-acetylmuramate: L-alanyl-gamma-D-glutamyl-meso-diaminopimelate ligase
MHYHLIGVCGTAMASLAGMLQARGHRVTVRTRTFIRRCPPMLESLGILPMIPCRPKNEVGISANGKLPRNLFVVVSVH